MADFSRWLLVLSTVFVAPNAFAQDGTEGGLPVCTTTASDPDGDGFGWEIFVERSFGREKDFESCVVTADSQGMPTLVNRQTGANVQLLRAYWNANNDIANRQLRCEPFTFNETTAVYEKADPSYLLDNRTWFLKDTVYRHNNLFSNFPRMSTVFQHAVGRLPEGVSIANLSANDPLWDEGIQGILPLWTINNGIYYGAMALRISPYVEIISHGSGTDNAVRVWGDDNTANTYHDCYATDGSLFIPTGSTSTASDGLTPPDENILVALSPPDTNTNPVMNLQTGSSVVLSNDLWNYNTQLAGRNIRCQLHEWGWRDPSAYGIIDLDDSEAGWMYVFHPSSGENQVRISYRSHTHSNAQWRTQKVSLTDGQLGTWFESPEYTGWEQTEGQFRLWNVNDNKSFHGCKAEKLTALITDVPEGGFSGSITGKFASIEVPFFPAQTVPQETTNSADTTDTNNTSDTNSTMDSTSTTGTSDTNSSTDNNTDSDTTTPSPTSGTGAPSGSGSFNFGVLFLLCLAGIARRTSAWYQID